MWLQNIPENIFYKKIIIQGIFCNLIKIAPLPPILYQAIKYNPRKSTSIILKSVKPHNSYFIFLFLK
jgi:hypothetical protein